jgi:hypothetical protein
MAAKSVTARVRNYLRVLQTRGLKVRFGVVFGSQIKGTARPDSDLDLIVVSPRFDRSYTWTDASLLWRVAAVTDYRIEPIPCGEKQWETDDSSAIIEIARREGRKIKVA